MHHDTRNIDESKQGRVGKLLSEGRWYVLSVVTVYVILSMLSYQKADPAWSHATVSAHIGNLGGRTGAWIADIVLYMFGFSGWFLILPMLRNLVVGYRRVAGAVARGADGKSSGDFIVRAFGVLSLMLGASGMEHLRMYTLAVEQPRAPGGVLGELLGQLLTVPVGFTGATLLFGLLFLLGVSLYFQLSLLSVAEIVGYWIERLAVGMMQAVGTLYDKWLGRAASLRRDLAVRQEEARPSMHGLEENSGMGRHEPSISATPVTPVASVASTAPLQVLQQQGERSVSPTPPLDVPVLTDVLTTANLQPVHASVQTDAELAIDNHGEAGSHNIDPPTAVPVQSSALNIVPQVVSVPKMESASPVPTVSFNEMEPAMLPSTELLDPPPQTQETVSEEFLERTSRLIEQKLSDFGVQVKVVAAYPGPVITRYEIEPANGVKGSQIVNLSRDLARALSLTSVRVVEVVQGKTCMGLELPNAKRQIVRLKEIVGSRTYGETSSTLPVALGKDISGNAVVADLAKMPHLLVAGTTGSGKSVGINATILSLLYRADPNDVRMILIDPKMLELSVYEGIPHLLAPVVTDMKQAGHALNWAVAEMERRYKLMAKLGVRNLAGYNEKIKLAKETGNLIANPFSLSPEDPEPLGKLPSIVVIIDELADLMMVVGKKVEELIARIAQKARAAGIHLILATQRPSVDVITGLIKANIPTRIAFQVSSKIDSRTILDQMGAETLLGMGDMLYMPPGSPLPVRVHGAFVSDEEVHRVVNFLRTQGEPDYVEGILEGGVMSETNDVGAGVVAGGSAPGDGDDMYAQAVDIVLKNNKASISLVQRHLRIGYNRAARLLEQMENNGVVSPMQSNGNRDILVKQGAPSQ